MCLPHINSIFWGMSGTNRVDVTEFNIDEVDIQ